MKKIAFNTGHLYTAEGQRIAVQEVDKGAVFVDFDRGIWGFVPLPRPESLGLMDLAKWTYHAYLYSQYEYVGSHTAQGAVIESIRNNGYDAFKSQSDVRVCTKRDLAF